MFRFTLRQLEYAAEIANQGGIAQAARQLGISQPSVAQSLDKLELETGLTLFERHHARGATPTAQGRVFLEHVEALLDHARQIERNADALTAMETGEIRLGCFATIASFFLPDLIQTFKSIHPGIRLVPQEAALDVLASRVQSGAYDISLTYDIGDLLHDLNAEPLMSVKPVVLLPATHAKVSNRTIRLSSLANEPYVMFDAPGSREYFSDMLNRAGISPDVAYASQSLEGVRSAVAAGLGFSIAALTPEHDVSYGGRRIASVPLVGATPELNIVAVTRPHSGDNPLVRRFLQVSTAYFDRATACAAADVQGL